MVLNTGSKKNAEYHGVVDINEGTLRRLETYYEPYNRDLWTVFDRHIQPREHFDGYRWEYPLSV